MAKRRTLVCLWSCLSLADVDTVWVLVCSVHDILDGTVDIAEGNIYLLHALLPQSLSLLNGLVHVTSRGKFVVAETQLLHTLLALGAAKELPWDFVIWCIGREDPFWTTLACSEVKFDVVGAHAIAFIELARSQIG